MARCFRSTKYRVSNRTPEPGVHLLETLRTAEPSLRKDVGAQGALKEHTYERSNQAFSGVWLRSGTAGVGGWDRAIPVAVTFNRTHNFIDKGRERGITYEALKSFEKDLNAHLKTGSLKLHLVIVPMSRD